MQSVVEAETFSLPANGGMSTFAGATSPPSGSRFSLEAFNALAPEQQQLTSQRLRGGPKSIASPQTNAPSDADPVRDVRLQAGDIIFIPDAGSKVALAGNFRVPANYEKNGKASLRDLLRMADGHGVEESVHWRLSRVIL